MGQERGARFEFECYDLGHLQMLHHFVDRGLIKAPIFIQFVMGVLGGVSAGAGASGHLKQTADNLFGDGLHVLGACGRPPADGHGRTRRAMGGHVRVGLEDNLYIARGSWRKSNAEQVEMVREIVEGIGREVATPDEARAMLELKGRDKVGF
jgi:uncharacterized protein (DUF849 family)